MARFTEPQPHLEDGTTYYPLRPTKLDKIENFHFEVQVGAIANHSQETKICQDTTKCAVALQPQTCPLS